MDRDWPLTHQLAVMSNVHDVLSSQRLSSAHHQTLFAMLGRWESSMKLEADMCPTTHVDIKVSAWHGMV